LVKIWKDAIEESKKKRKRVEDDGVKKEDGAKRVKAEGSFLLTDHLESR